MTESPKYWKDYRCDICGREDTLPRQTAVEDGWRHFSSSLKSSYGNEYVSIDICPDHSQKEALKRMKEKVEEMEDKLRQIAVAEEM